MLNILYKKLQLLGSLSPDSLLELGAGPHWRTSDPPASLAVLSGSVSPFASVYGCVSVTTSAARQTAG